MLIPLNPLTHRLMKLGKWPIITTVLTLIISIGLITFALVQSKGNPQGVYLATRHVVRGTATFNTSFIASPSVWPRKISSYGAGNENPIYYAVNLPSTDPDLFNPTVVPWTPTVWVVSATPTQTTLDAYVYH